MSTLKYFLVQITNTSNCIFFFRISHSIPELSESETVSSFVKYKELETKLEILPWNETQAARFQV